MQTGLTLTTDATTDPVTVEEVKENFLIVAPDDDALILRLIKVATKWCEDFTRRQFIRKTWAETFTQFPERGVIMLSRRPLVSVTSVQYVDANGDTQTLSSSDYYVITNRETGLIDRAYNVTWPTTRSIREAVTVTYVAGYGTAASDVPDTIRQAVIALVGHWLEHRDLAVTGTIVQQMPLHVESLLWMERTLEAP